MVKCLNEQACTRLNRSDALAKLQAVAAVSFAIHRFQVGAAGVDGAGC